MANSAPTSSPELQKRRSSRIVQAVPLSVTGVDALGRPFQERTSTLTINCHGCRYQSKHYVLKNMWVTLSVPHPEADHQARTVRARVMWIRRPHTVRELFQVGIELEAPGNLWGIAFPPPDWFPLPDSATIPAGTVSEIPLDTAELPLTEDLPLEAEGNLRTMPLGSPPAASQPAGGAGDPSLLLARHMNRLVNEARQQLQAAVRESAAQAVSAEARPLIAALQSQLHEVAKHSLEIVAEQTVHETVEKSARASEMQLQQLREFWNRQLAESVEQAHQSWSARIEETERQLRGAFAQDLQNESRQAITTLEQVTRDFQKRLNSAQENLSRLSQGTENAAAPFVEEIEQRVRVKSDEVRAQIDDLDRASRQHQEQTAAAAEAAHTAWLGRLDADMQSVKARLDERIETSLEGAVQQSADRLARRSQEIAEQMEREAGLRIASMGRALLDAGTEAEARINALRNSFDEHSSRSQALLAQVEAAAQQIEEHTEQLEALEQTLLGEMERRAATLLESQSQALDERAAASLAAWTERFEPAMESAGRQVVSRLGAELEQQLSSQVEKAGQAVSELQGQTQIAARTIDQHGEALRTFSDQAVKAAVERLEGAINRLEQDLQESGRSAATKWLSEIDTKATETTHNTFESLFKTAEWYEKKVQTQMHNTLEKGLEQAQEALRERAGELSRLFAAEMDHYSRSYVEHTGQQIEEAGRESLGGIQKQAADLSAAASRAITQQAQNQTDAALGQFRGKASGLLGQIASQLETLAGQTKARLDAEVSQSHTQFRAGLTRDIQEAVNSSRLELGAEIAAARESLRSETQREAAELQQALTSLNDQAVEGYRRRLEATSETWLLTALTKLNQQTNQQLDSLTRSTEARLRETCTQVFTSVGESLRRRLIDVALQPLAEEARDRQPEAPAAGEESAPK